MEEAKRCKHNDRLSELPDSIIYEILWFLPMTDVVRTPVLSKRWRNLWTKTPFLNFDNFKLMLFEDVDKLRKFVHRALLCWNGDSVSKFKFDWFQKRDDDYAMYSDIDLWVSFAVRNGVEELDLHVRNKGTSSPWNGKRGMYRVPQCVYSSSSLKKLTIKYCHLEILGNVQLNQLNSLRIECFQVNQHTINQILLGSPQLRVLESCTKLRVVGDGEKLTIRSSSLKELLIHKSSSNFYCVEPSVELRIWTPNLETLEIVGVPFRECMLMDVSSVTNATLGFSGKLHDADALGFLSQILPIIQHAENVTLLNCCTKVLGVIKKKCMHSSFPNVKSLELRWCLNYYEQEVGLLQIFPRLERLLLKEEEALLHRHDRESCEFEAILPESFLLQLRTIEVTWFDSSSMFPLIETLLKCASKLERMVFRVKKREWYKPPSPSSLFLVSQKLLRMPRSSPSCKIDIYDCTRADN